ncbi:MAG: hypothetical protein M1819_003373 [Sarea resinae]|nr:MAG: hypothetical protein M1819_003373 [Sarea resinae]
MAANLAYQTTLPLESLDEDVSDREDEAHTPQAQNGFQVEEQDSIVTHVTDTQLSEIELSPELPTPKPEKRLQSSALNRHHLVIQRSEEGHFQRPISAGMEPSFRFPKAGPYSADLVGRKPLLITQNVSQIEKPALTRPTTANGSARPEASIRSVAESRTRSRPAEQEQQVPASSQRVVSSHMVDSLSSNKSSNTHDNSKKIQRESSLKRQASNSRQRQIPSQIPSVAVLEDQRSVFDPHDAINGANNNDTPVCEARAFVSHMDPPSVSVRGPHIFRMERHESSSTHSEAAQSTLPKEAQPPPMGRKSNAHPPFSISLVEGLSPDPGKGSTASHEDESLPRRMSSSVSEVIVIEDDEGNEGDDRGAKHLSAAKFSALGSGNSRREECPQTTWPAVGKEGRVLPVGTLNGVSKNTKKPRTRHTTGHTPRNASSFSVEDLLRQVAQKHSDDHERLAAAYSAQSEELASLQLTHMLLLESHEDVQKKQHTLERLEKEYEALRAKESQMREERNALQTKDIQMSEKYKSKCAEWNKFVQGLANDQKKLREDMWYWELKVQELRQEKETYVKDSEKERKSLEEAVGILRKELEDKSGLLAEERDRNAQMKKDMENIASMRCELTTGMAACGSQITGIFTELQATLEHIRSESVQGPTEKLAHCEDLLAKLCNADIVRPNDIANLNRKILDLVQGASKQFELSTDLKAATLKFEDIIGASIKAEFATFEDRLRCREEMQEEILSLERAKAALAEQATAREAILAVLESKESQLENGLRMMQTGVTDANFEVAALRASLKAQQEEIARLQTVATDNEILRAQVDKSKAEASNLEQELQSRLDDLESLQTDFEKLQARREEAEEKLKKANEQVQNAGRKAKKENDEMRARLEDSAKLAREELELQFEDKLKVSATLKNRVQETLCLVQRKLENSEAALLDSCKNITELEAAKAELEREKDDRARVLDAFKDNISELQSISDSNDAEWQAQKLQALKDGIGERERRATEAEKALAETNVEVQNCAEQISVYQKEIERLQGDKKALSEELDDVTAQFEKLSKEKEKADNDLAAVQSRLEQKRLGEDVVPETQDLVDFNFSKFVDDLPPSSPLSSVDISTPEIFKAGAGLTDNLLTEPSFPPRQDSPESGSFRSTKNAQRANSGGAPPSNPKVTVKTSTQLHRSQTTSSDLPSTVREKRIVSYDGRATDSGQHASLRSSKPHQHSSASIPTICTPYKRVAQGKAYDKSQQRPDTPRTSYVNELLSSHPRIPRRPRQGQAEGVPEQEDRVESVSSRGKDRAITDSDSEVSARTYADTRTSERQLLKRSIAEASKDSLEPPRKRAKRVQVQSPRSVVENSQDLEVNRNANPQRIQRPILRGNAMPAAQSAAAPSGPSTPVIDPRSKNRCARKSNQAPLLS